MDAFEKPELKSTEDLLMGFKWYMLQGSLTAQEDISRFCRIMDELDKRKVPYFQLSGNSNV